MRAYFARRGGPLKNKMKPRLSARNAVDLDARDGRAPATERRKNPGMAAKTAMKIHPLSITILTWASFSALWASEAGARKGAQAGEPQPPAPRERVEPDDPASVAALEKLKVHLVRNFQGAVEIAEMTGPGIADADLVHLKGLHRIESLKIEHQGITDAALANLSGLSRLRRLYLNDVKVSDGGLRHLGKLEGLEVLALEKTRISGPGLESLKRLKKLRVLNLGQCQVGDDALASLEPLASLETLALHQTRVTDAGMKHLGRLAGLIVLNLSGCDVTDNCLESFRNLANLRIIHMKGCKVTAEGAAEFTKKMPGLAIFR